MPESQSKMADPAAQDEASKTREALFKSVCASFFTAVVAHTLNLQSEAILFRNACKGDLARAAQLMSASNAATGLLGVLVNQMGGRLSDSLGRRPFYQIGPFFQILAGLAAYTWSENPMVLFTAKTIRMIATTFSGTVMGMAGMRDVFQGQEFGIRMSKASAIIGMAIMVGPLLEGMILKRVKVGGEKVTYLALTLIGALSFLMNQFGFPETLPATQRKAFDLKSALAGANPFGFVKIYTEGSPLLKKLATIGTMQTMIDGKNMSDLGQLWMREHLKLSLEGIRNFIMAFGFLSTLSSAKLVPTMLKKLTVTGFTTVTNTTNMIAFTVRGAAENHLLYFGSLPLMLPGVNGASNSALTPIINRELAASGFGTGESSAWINNLRVLASVIATLLYANTYAVCIKRGLPAGLSYISAAIVGAAIPQALFMLTVKKSELEAKPEAKK